MIVPLGPEHVDQVARRHRLRQGWIGRYLADWRKP